MLILIEMEVLIVMNFVIMIQINKIRESVTVEHLMLIQILMEHLTVKNSV